MNFLVTGVAGFLGSHVAEKLITLGHNVSGLDNLIGGEMSNIPGGVQFFRNDLSDYDNLEQAFSNQEIVIHSACTAHEGLSVFSPAFISKNTYQITLNALSWAIKSGARKFVYLSSMARYGTQSSNPFTEEMVPNPQDPYGIAKYASELAVKNLCETHGLDYVILVPHNIIGPRQKYNDPYRNVASIMINRILQGKQPIIYGDGNQMRCFSFIDDVVDPLLNSCFLDSASKQVINIGPDEQPITINQLAALIGEILDYDIQPIYFKNRPQEVKVATCSAQKARQLLNYKTTISLEKGLTNLAHWIQQKGSKDFDYYLPIEILSDLTPKTWSDRRV
jgi:UDP-glucose 4-epimerase